MRRIILLSIIISLFIAGISSDLVHAGDIFLTSYDFTDDDIPTIASRYDFIVTKITEASSVALIKARYPSTKSIYYKNSLTHGGTEGHLVLDVVTGKKIVHKLWGWYLHDISDSRYVSDFTNSIYSTLSAYPQFDGVFLDDVWMTLKASELVQEGTNTPANLPHALLAGWQRYMNALLASVKARIGDRLSIINASPYSVDASPNYIASCDGIMDEGFAHANWNFSEKFQSTASWLAHLQRLVSTTAASKYYLAQSGVKDGATLDEIDRLVKYCYTSFLLGLSGGNYAKHYFIPSMRYSKYYWYDVWQMSLGNPKGAYFRVKGKNSYRRDFVKGIVLVNPTDKGETIVLEVPFFNQSGGRVSAINLGAREGVILLAAETFLSQLPEKDQ